MPSGQRFQRKVTSWSPTRRGDREHLAGDTSFGHGGDTRREDEMSVCTNGVRPLATVLGGAGNVNSPPV